MRDRKGRFLKGFNSGPYKRGDYLQICLVCGKRFYSSPSRIKIGKGKYCSRKCAEVTFFKKGYTPLNKSWFGDKNKYYALHLWVGRKLGKPTKCEFCGILANGHKIHWANKSGEYRRDLSDWLRLCVKCHEKYDLERLRI